MKQFFKISRSHYLQYIRSYAFLVTLAIALYAAYSFVPPPGAGYRTLRIGHYVGVNNSAWTGYLTAMMSSIYISTIGLFLINSNIKRDIDTGVGMIIATTSISNLRYLFTKALSNFMVLMSIMGIIMLMSMAVFMLRHEPYPFEISQFILPFLFITVPSLFFIAAFAVAAEVFLYRSSVWMNAGCLTVLIAAMAVQTNVHSTIDFFGVKAVTVTMQRNLIAANPGIHPEVSMGFIFSKKNNLIAFTFQGIHWSASFLLSRLCWMCAGLLLIIVSSRFFHRFDISPMVKKQKKTSSDLFMPKAGPIKDIKLSLLPHIKPSFGIMPLIKTEFLLLVRKGPRWLWLVNLGGITALIFSPVTFAHQFILPVLWFLQVGRWSDLSTKEKANNIHYFSYASYKPLTRLFSAQLIAGILLSLFLAAPLLVRYLIGMQFLSAGMIFIGALFIVLAAAFLGLLTGGKKLFEILFFLCVYSNVNSVPFTDYFGALNHSTVYVMDMLIATVCLALFSFQWRKMEMKRL